MVTLSSDRMMRSRDCAQPALCRIKTSKKVDNRYFPASTNAPGTAETCIQK